MKNSDYWAKRFSMLETSLNQYGQGSYAQIEPAFVQAQQEMQKQIDAWYGRIATNNQISMTQARKFLTTSGLEEFHWSVEEYIQYGRENAVSGQWMKQLENASAKVHISRLEALQVSTQQAMEVAFGNELDAVDAMVRKVYTQGYYRTCYEVQKGLSIGFDMGTVDEGKLSKLIAKPWTADGRTFSDRIWQSKATMVSQLHSELTRTCILGQAPDEAIKNMTQFLKDKTKNARYQAGRLVMTEQAFFASAAQQDAFNDLDVEEFEIVATIDSRTSPICQEMDGKHFPMQDFQAGTTAPPFHVFCRSCTCPYFDDEFSQEDMRAARGEDGETYYVPGDMTYPEWKKQFVDGGDKGGLDFMGKPTVFSADSFKVKAYEADGFDGVFTQTFSGDAQKTIALIDEMQKDGVVRGVSKTVVAKDLPGIAAYDHGQNTLYVNEKLSNAAYIQKELASGYFVAETAEDVIRHEMFHKQHWDFILSKGGNRVTIKQEIESALRKYVAEQQSCDFKYIKTVVCENALNSFRRYNSLNELIAEVLLQETKDVCKDQVLLRLVRGCVE